MHYYIEQDKDMHKESDKKPDIAAGIAIFNQLKSGVPINDLISSAIIDGSRDINNWYVGFPPTS